MKVKNIILLLATGIITGPVLATNSITSKVQVSFVSNNDEVLFSSREKKGAEVVRKFLKEGQVAIPFRTARGKDGIRKEVRDNFNKVLVGNEITKDYLKRNRLRNYLAYGWRSQADRTCQQYKISRLFSVIKNLRNDKSSENVFKMIADFNHGLSQDFRKYKIPSLDLAFLIQQSNSSLTFRSSPKKSKYKLVLNKETEKLIGKSSSYQIEDSESLEIGALKINCHFVNIDKTAKDIKRMVREFTINAKEKIYKIEEKRKEERAKREREERRRQDAMKNLKKIEEEIQKQKKRHGKDEDYKNLIGKKVNDDSRANRLRGIIERPRKGLKVNKI